MGKPKGSMQKKFEKKIDEKARIWLKENGFTPPYVEARKLEDLPKFVTSYFKRSKISLNNEETNEPNA